ncbi:MAG: hypothetical protein A2342_00960 [Gallionellales bacterium RIFOXYB12_FULL_54_9]|nr:MAG: hypothetical protein A2342_00960 [Gallionellales bacterium RIFOXYB12_FULL_54_9]
MLPLFRKQLCMVLCPDRVILFGLGEGPKRKVILQTILPCQAVEGTSSWEPALAVFEQWLASHEMGRAEVTVMLSNQFVRFTVMPDSSKINGQAEAQTLAHILFEGIYGSLASQWHFQVEAGKYGESRLVAAMDTKLLTRLTDMLGATTLRLWRITPYLVAAFNRFYKQLPYTGSLFVVIESGVMVIAGLQDSQLMMVNRVPFDEETAEPLTQILQREALTSGLDLPSIPVCIHRVGRPDFKLPVADELVFHSLQEADKSGARFLGNAAFEMVSAWEYA